jgi:HD-GYP domain-containing protein (c-di-GMP phosphodiesterase class II)
MFLRALVHAGERLRHDPEGHQSISHALSALEEAAKMLTSPEPEVVLTLADGALFLGPTMLPHASVEFNGLVAEMQRRSIDSITVTRDADPADLADLAAVIGGVSNDLPVGGTVRLNERPLSVGDLGSVPMSGLRRTYAASLETLRSLGSGGRVETARVAEAIEGFIGSPSIPSLMLATVRNEDETTFYHSVNVCLLSVVVGSALGVTGENLRYLATGALLHDLGRVLLDEAALTKPGSLTGREWAQVRLHPQEGAQAILAGTGPGIEIAAAVALEHHVRLDGDGYPDLRGREPHPFSRIVAVADVYDAITSRRPHRPARTPQEAMEALTMGSGTAYDPGIVTAFLQVMGEHPPGSLLRTGGGELVMVTDSGGDSLSGLVVLDAEGHKVPDPRQVDLAPGEVVTQVLAEDAGIDPAEMLEAVEG